MCDVSTCIYRSWSHIGHDPDTGGTSRKDVVVDGGGGSWYPWSWFMVGPCCLMLMAFLTLHLCHSCSLPSTLILFTDTECPVIKQCSPTPVGLSKFRCSLNLTPPSIWVKPQATTIAWSRPVEADRNVSFRFKLRSKVSLFTIFSDSWSHEQYISYVSVVGGLDEALNTIIQLCVCCRWFGRGPKHNHTAVYGAAGAVCVRSGSPGPRSSLRQTCASQRGRPLQLRRHRGL